MAEIIFLPLTKLFLFPVIHELGTNKLLSQQRSAAERASWFVLGGEFCHLIKD